MIVTVAGPSVRVWILAVALGSFAAGTVVGFLLPNMMASAAQIPATPEQEAGEITQKYGLSDEQHRRMVMVFEEQERQDLKILMAAKPHQLDPDLQSKRLLQSRKTQQRIRFVLDEQQRALYDRDSTINKPGTNSSSGEDENR